MSTRYRPCITWKLRLHSSGEFAVICCLFQLLNMDWGNILNIYFLFHMIHRDRNITGWSRITIKEDKCISISNLPQSNKLKIRLMVDKIWSRMYFNGVSKFWGFPAKVIRNPRPAPWYTTKPLLDLKIGAVGMLFCCKASWGGVIRLDWRSRSGLWGVYIWMRIMNCTISASILHHKRQACSRRPSRAGGRHPQRNVGDQVVPMG